MADYTYDGPEAPARSGRNVASLTNWAGAAVSFALLIGVGVWGYKLIVRDITGIPVVQAMEGPVRIAPDDPGGTRASHQGLSVNDVAGTGTAAPAPDRLLLAPRGVSLTEEDVPQEVLTEARTPADRVAPAVVAPGPDGPGLAAEEQEGPAPVPPALADADVDPIQALADQIAADAVPFSELTPEPQPDPAADLAGDLTEPVEEAPVQVAANVPAGALTRSLRPAQRPGNLATQPVALASAPAAPEGPAEISPDTLPAGTRLAQLGAYDSPETARKEWDRFSGRFGEFMEGKDRVIERATSGGRVFYRLRAAGFEDLADARRFCAAFVAENSDCIPVTTR